MTKRHLNINSYILFVLMVFVIFSCRIQQVNNNTVLETKMTDTLQVDMPKETLTKQIKITKSFIKGSWEDEECVGCYSGSRTYYTFKDSTFTTLYYSYTDEIDNDECEIWRIYSTGKYYLEDKYLYLDGHFTDKTYKNENNDRCGKKGKFKKQVEIYSENDWLYLGFKYKPTIPTRYWLKLKKK